MDRNGRDQWTTELQAAVAEGRRRELIDKIEAPVTDASGTWAWLIPKPGFCIKCLSMPATTSPTTTSAFQQPTPMKVFINICQHERISEPIPMAPENQRNDDDTEAKFRIPLSCGQARPEKDRSRRPCKAYDVIVNPQTVKRCFEDNEFRRFVALLCMMWIKQKSEPQLNADQFVNVNIDVKGTPDLQRVRISDAFLTESGRDDAAVDTALKMPENTRNATAPSMVAGRPTGIGLSKLVEEMSPSASIGSGSNATQVSTPYTIEPYGSYDWSARYGPHAPRSPYFRDKVPGSFVIRASLPHTISSIRQIDVTVLRRYVTVSYAVSQSPLSSSSSSSITSISSPPPPFMTIPLEYPVSSEPLQAKYVRRKNTLVLQLQVSLPTEVDPRTPSCQDAVEEEARQARQRDDDQQARGAEERTQAERRQREEDDVMKQRKEWLADLNSVSRGELPPSLELEVSQMPRERLQALLMSLQDHVQPGNDNEDDDNNRNVQARDPAFNKIPAEMLDQLASYIRKRLGLADKTGNHSSRSRDRSKDIDGDDDGGESSNQKLSDKIKQSKPSEPLTTPQAPKPSSGTKSQRLFGVELKNRFLFALDH